jgi:hypothetical protein
LQFSTVCTFHVATDFLPPYTVYSISVARS